MYGLDGVYGLYGIVFGCTGTFAGRKACTKLNNISKVVDRYLTCSSNTSTLYLSISNSDWLLDDSVISTKHLLELFAFRRIDSDAENRDIAVVIINGNDGVCKQFFKKENVVVLHSINHEYDDIIIPAEKWDEECRIVGVVVARFENFKNVKVKKTLRG